MCPLALGYRGVSHVRECVCVCQGRDGEGSKKMDGKISRPGNPHDQRKPWEVQSGAC